jgi:hypothetical protein
MFIVYVTNIISAFASGLNGLTGIQSTRKEEHVIVGRPLLPFNRNKITATAMQHGLLWVEDPTNEKESDFRPKVRSDLIKWNQQANITLEDFKHITNTFTQIDQINRKWQSKFITQYCKLDYDNGIVIVSKSGLQKICPEIQYMVIKLLLEWVSNRLSTFTVDACIKLLNRLQKGEKFCTLGGCLVATDQSSLVIARERALHESKAQTAMTTRFGQEKLYDERLLVKLHQYDPANPTMSKNRYKGTDKRRKYQQVNYENKLIPGYKGLVDTDPDGELVIRPWTIQDWHFIKGKFLQFKCS